MFNFDADLYNIDAHFTDEATSIVTFNNVTNIGTIVLVGPKNTGKYSVFGQIFEKFRRAPGLSKEKHESKRMEIRNTMFRFPIQYTAQVPTDLQQHREYFEGCKTLVYVIDANKPVDTDAANAIQFIRNSLIDKVSVHVLFNQSDLLGSNLDTVIQNQTTLLKPIFNDAVFHTTSLMDGSTVRAIVEILQSSIPQSSKMVESMDRFAKSLELKNCFLIDLQTKLPFLTGGDQLSLETYVMVQHATEMFVSMASMMDAKSAQSTMSIEMDGVHYHLFWSTFDVILVGVSDKHIPTATSKNNVLALLNTLRRILQQ
ncbi:hypothetical protein TVAG_003600 [Trichomonas vaginalis G3]|uniref:Gtr1/RagA G protein conserved region containing protein n=1 Tax=Trichomonas vaginalis (strain ATCC PRA-98 / G3) TaxID=412133 RepID=A2E574_TRIV3|nr:hypothetical protein TVAGG3_0475610 [Trichomonas vaginalis G3]EAY12154.1 hypothetical protein TVAG_003600 [Trichomonas vaginalis G3]KAI5515377.1 hypothetical protein TVAGG3_0475610 [Trichomonas vaginalis G3]|eukprot:XP_001324377.1 hypothetical protein [Trichomonas vaginalis G3]